MAEALQVRLAGAAHRDVGAGRDEHRGRGADAQFRPAPVLVASVWAENLPPARAVPRVLTMPFLPVTGSESMKAASVVGDAHRAVGMQGDGDGGSAVTGIGDLFDRVVHQLAQGGVEHVQAQVDRRSQAGVLNIVGVR